MCLLLNGFLRTHGTPSLPTHTHSLSHSLSTRLALPQTVSYRHLDMLEETYVVNQMKEDVSFVAPDFRQYLKE